MAELVLPSRSSSEPPIITPTSQRRVLRLKVLDKPHCKRETEELLSLNPGPLRSVGESAGEKIQIL